MHNDDQPAQTYTGQGVPHVDAATVRVAQGGIGRATAREIAVTEGGIGLARGDTITVTNGGVGVLMARQGQLENANVVFLVAREVRGDARILVDLRAAVILGSVVAGGLGLVRWLTNRQRH
jgi:hypothetical protein